MEVCPRTLHPIHLSMKWAFFTPCNPDDRIKEKTQKHPNPNEFPISRKKNRDPVKGVKGLEANFHVYRERKRPLLENNILFSLRDEVMRQSKLNLMPKQVSTFVKAYSSTCQSEFVKRSRAFWKSSSAFLKSSVKFFGNYFNKKREPLLPKND